MQLELTDIKVLKFICLKSRKQPVTNDRLSKKFGEESLFVLEKLESEGYIQSPYCSDPIQVGFSSGDDWTITDKGLYFLQNYNSQKNLSMKEKIINYCVGFVSGLLTGCLVQLFIRFFLK